MTEKLLIGMLPRTMPTTIQEPVMAPQTIIDDEPPEDVATESEPDIELRLSDSLKEPLKSIWLFAKEKDDWVTVRDVQRKTFAVLKGKDSKQIRQYFGLLADMGFGQVDEEGKSDSSVGFLSN